VNSIAVPAIMLAYTAVTFWDKSCWSFRSRQ